MVAEGVVNPAQLMNISKTVFRKLTFILELVKWVAKWLFVSE